MKTYLLIIIIIIAFVIGFYSYKLVPFKFTPNIPPLFEMLNDELAALDEKFKKENLTEEEKFEILNREKEIYALLKQFFGKDIKEII